MGPRNHNLQKFVLVTFTVISIIQCIPLVHAEEYYADISINVDDSGFIDIEGITNYPDLLVKDSEIYTSKKQSYWLLNITKEQVFSDYIFTLTLPKDSSINYIKSIGTIRIEEELGNLIVKGFGQNKTLSIVVQYQIKKSLNIFGEMDFFTTYVLSAIALIFVIIVISLFIGRKKSRIREKTTSKIKENNLKGLTDRQKKIIELLININRPMTQKEIQDELKIPKAAVSRNLQSLEIKDLIEKEKAGMSNLVKIKKH